MARTIIQGFQGLKSNLEITDLQEATVSQRQQNIRDAVAEKLTVLDDFLTGSYKRSTMIAPLKEADIDIFIVLDSSYYSPDGQASLLDRVKRVLKNTYPNTPDISRDGQAVTISFRDFKVDVVPAFFRRGGGYLIANTKLQQWIPTNPKQHINIWSEANDKHNNDLVPLLKMLKCWKREANVDVSSFFLECLILQILTNVKIADFSSGARFVFDKARSAIRLPVPDPAGYNHDVGQYLMQNTKNDAVSKLETAYTRAKNAELAASKGNLEEAFRNWRLIFGSCFPAYG